MRWSTMSMKKGNSTYKKSSHVDVRSPKQMVKEDAIQQAGGMGFQPTSL